MRPRSTAQALILLLAALFVLALAAAAVTTLAEEGVTLGSLLLVVPSICILVLLAVGIGGALGRGSERGR